MVARQVGDPYWPFLRMCRNPVQDLLDALNGAPQMVWIGIRINLRGAHIRDLVPRKAVSGRHLHSSRRPLLRIGADPRNDHDGREAAGRFCPIEV